MDGIIIEGKSTSEAIALIEYIKSFSVHYDLLLQRYQRFEMLNVSPVATIDVSTYLDMIVVQLRAMCLENPKYENNYTIQILLRKVGEDTVAKKVEAMLDEQFFLDTEDFPIRMALKTLANKFVCHYDNSNGINKGRWALAENIEKQLRNPYDNHNLDYIMQTVIDCVERGLMQKIKRADDGTTFM